MSLPNSKIIIPIVIDPTTIVVIIDDNELLIEDRTAKEKINTLNIPLRTAKRTPLSFETFSQSVADRIYNLSTAIFQFCNKQSIVV